MNQKIFRRILIFVAIALLLALGACVPVPEGGFEPAIQGDQGEQDDQSDTTSTGVDLDQGGVPITGCDEPQGPFITGFDVLQTPNLSEPEPRMPFRDPVFATCLVRVTDRVADLSPGDPSGGLKNEYSRVQSFNSDGRFLIARSTDALWYLYDASTLQALAELPLEDEPRWSPTDPYLVFYISETRLVSFNIQTGDETTVHDFKSDLPFEPVMVWTRYEGSPSADGQIWGLIAQDQEWLAAAYLTYDLETDRVLATRLLDDLPDLAREVDSVTISPSGKYFLAYNDLYCDHGVLGDDAHPCGLMVYDRDLQNGRSLLRIVGHSDLAFDAQGRDVLIYQDIDTDFISMLDLETGAVTPLWQIDFSRTPIGFHFSGRAFDAPGWALVSTYSGGHPDDFTWMDDQVFAVELKANGRVVRLAHTHSLVDEDQEHDYWAEPQASVNQDFTRVIFTTNWGRSGSEEVDMYMVFLPSGWFTQLP
jgi:hypothetical protein